MAGALVFVLSLFVLLGAIQQVRAYRRRGIRTDWKKLPAALIMTLECFLEIALVFAAAFGIGWCADALGFGDFGAVLALIVAVGGIVAVFVLYNRRAAKFQWWRRAG